MAATLQLNYDQIKSLIDQLDMEEKEKLADYLDDLTLKKRYKEFTDKMKDFPLSLDDIQKEVEEVRKERYEKRQKV